ncbi:FAD-dependent oxidoreductase [Aureimonas sp. AU40]|uniref:FAD-dependent oxidoreductase n=1 Tax=Aureimonas sp. AU40 TaxID=1637747 RepID=UPI000782356F|nr:NAD(P)/FAD-dependent oxidoreductase [Aureimonas sp. AU40]
MSSPHSLEPLDRPGPEGARASVDVAIIGAGLAGTASALRLAALGYKVALVDANAEHPEEFRAEKMGLLHLALFEKLGLDATARPALTPMLDNQVYRLGRLYARKDIPEFGFSYAQLVNTLRRAVPKEVLCVTGKVTEIEPLPEGRRLRLADGAEIDARLVVISTGLGEAVRRMAGVKRTVTSRGHSLAFGFDLAGQAKDYGFGTLNYYSKRFEERYAYLTFFPIGDTMRANFFTYRDMSDPFVKRFRAEPQAMLRELMPEISDLCGGFELVGPVSVRPVDLSVSEGYEQPGLVLVGDAFCTTCPVPGVGISRVMTDVERLCNVHIPAWFATPGMGVDKIGNYYRDPVKVETDRVGMRVSWYARQVSVGESMVWRLRRGRNQLVRRSLLALRPTPAHG